MSQLPDDLLYTKDHEWVRLNGDGTAIIGITNYAQESLGDITFVEFPDTGSTFDTGETFGVVESVKAASDLYMPLSAEVIECNAAADDAPELLNSDPYGEGWLLKVKLTQDRQADDLLKSNAYAELI